MNHTLLNLLTEKKHSLIVSLPGNDLALAKAAWEAGADAVKVHINVEHRASKNVYGSFEQEQDFLLALLETAKGPCGIVAAGSLELALKDYQKAIDAGFDFISLYAHDAPVELLSADGVSKMIAFGSDYDLNNLPYLEAIGANIFEASVMKPDTYGMPLSAKELVTYARICATTRLPVVVPSQRNIQAGEVQSLIRCGVKATMIGAIVTGKTEDGVRRAVSEFRNAIDKGE